MKQNYDIISSRFEGVSKDDKGVVYGYNYTICFNKSLGNTVRMQGMCKGLDKAEKQEKRSDLWSAFRNWIGI